ncbi:MAG: helix-turn-helix transcriptional regulator [Bacteroidetes bacterium]|nr:helix-turn-helix transcriptional regulator [Bacteroidota bacterium]
MIVGKKLRILRTKAQISQQELADFVGVDRKTYINWENEISDVKSEFIPLLAEKLGVNIQDLFETSKDTNIHQIFNESTINNSIMVMLVSDKKMMNEVLRIFNPKNIS